MKWSGFYINVRIFFSETSLRRAAKKKKNAGEQTSYCR